MKGKLGIAVGLAAGYVLGTRAGRERYQQLTASAKRLADEPSLQRLQEELNGLFGSGRPEGSGEPRGGAPVNRGREGAGSSGTTVERV